MRLPLRAFFATTLAGFFVLAAVIAPLAAQDARVAAPQISFRVVEDFFQIPDSIWSAEAVGVALNAKGHIFLLNWGNHPLLEFAPDGKFIRSLGEESPIFHAAHGVRFDAQDNMWIVDAGNNVIGQVTSTIAPPTEGQLLRFKELQEETDQAATELNQIITTKIADIN